MRARPLWIVAISACWAAGAPAALAQPFCPEPTPGPNEATPASGAHGVTRDSPIRVLYTPGYFAPGGPANGTETMHVHDPDGALVDGVVQQVGDDAMFFLPDGLLDADTRYSVVATGVTHELVFHFTTGASLDGAPPEPGPILRISSDPSEPTCSAPEGGYRIGLALEPATDDGALGSLEYQVFLTRGPQVHAPIRVARQRHFASEEITVAFVLPEAQAESMVCIALRVEDGVGRATEGQGACFDPVTGDFFAPLCGVSTVGATRGGSPYALIVGIPALVLARRRRRT